MGPAANEDPCQCMIPVFWYFIPSNSKDWYQITTSFYWWDVYVTSLSASDHFSLFLPTQDFFSWIVEMYLRVLVLPVFIVRYRIEKCIREITRGSIVPLFNDAWIHLRSNEMFVQQMESSLKLSEESRLTSLNLSRTLMAQASTRPPSCTTPREPTISKCNF